jgi:uncharacterized membrane protein (UPF0127 family)
MAATVRIHNLTRQQTLADRAVRAESFWSRFRGLLGRSGLEPGEGMVFEPCNSVHMIGMQFAIDVIHLDKAGNVVRVVPSLRPNRLGPLVWRSHVVVELPAGTAAATETHEGDQISIEQVA